MSKFTTEVRFICEQYAGKTEQGDYTDVDSVISSARSSIFGNYPIFDETYRQALETKILRHYYTREIGAETVALWKLWLNNRMNEIMPYYNKLYMSELLTFNPFYDVDLKTTTSKEGNRTDTTNTEREYNENNLYSKTGNREMSENITTTKSDSSTQNEISNTDLTHESNKTDRSAHSGSGTTKVTDSGSTDTSSETLTTDAGTAHEDGWNKYSDTPQGAVTGLETDSYLTNATKTTNDSSKTNNTDVVTSENVSSATTSTSENNDTTSDSLDSYTDEKTKSNIVGSTSTTADTDIGSERTNTDNYARTESHDYIGKHTVNGTNVVASVDDYLEHIEGKRGYDSYSKRILEYRQTFLNIDKMVIEELEDLFFGLWE